MNKRAGTHYRYQFTNGTYRRYVRSEDPSLKIELQDESSVHGTYGHLLFTPRWREKRLTILSRDKNRCVICNSSEKLHVHHRQYHFIKSVQQFKPPWDYQDHLLITLCETCHKRGHNQYKVPIINI